MKKNVLFIMETLGGGGAEKVLTELLKRVNFSRYKIDLLLVVRVGIYLSEIPKEVRIKYLFKKEIYYWLIKRLTIYLKLKFLFKTIIKLKVRAKYDLEISFMQGTSLKTHALLNSKSEKISWVHTDISAYKWLKDPFFPFNEVKKAYEKMDKIIFVSKDALNVFETIFHVSGSRKVFYNPVDREEIIEKSKERSVAKNKLTICALGSVGPQKALDRLIRVAGRLRDEGMDFKIWIIGTGNAESELKKLTDDLSLGNIIEFLGYQMNPYPYLNAADIFISTSLAEGFSLVVAEAMCLGKPVVSTKVIGPTELLDNGKYGILTGHSDEEIFKALKEVMENEQLRKELAEKSLERSSIFDIERSIRDFEKILET